MPRHGAESTFMVNKCNLFIQQIFYGDNKALVNDSFHFWWTVERHWWTGEGTIRYDE